MSNPRKMSPNELVQRVEDLETHLELVNASRERLRRVAVAVADCAYGDVDDLGTISYALVNAREAGDLVAPGAEGEGK